MMVRLVIQDRHRPVNLLDKDQSDHLVGKDLVEQDDFFPPDDPIDLYRADLPGDDDLE